MAHDYKQMKINYKGFPDDKLIFIARYEANKISEDAVKALIEELKERDLEQYVFNIYVLLNGIEQVEFDKYIDKIRKLPCPYCYSKEELLNGANFHDGESVIEKVGCRNCLEKFYNKLLNKFDLRALTGVSGIINKVQIDQFNGKQLDRFKIKETKQELISFVYYNIGDIKMKWDDEEALLELIR